MQLKKHMKVKPIRKKYTIVRQTQQTGNKNADERQRAKQNSSNNQGNDRKIALESTGSKTEKEVQPCAMLGLGYTPGVTKNIRPINTQ